MKPLANSRRATLGLALASVLPLLIAVAALPFALHHAGYVGLSDDDASRTLIAWDFARAPTLDPTRSSWLPVHSYLLGAWLAVARDLSLAPRVFSLAATLGAVLAAFALARRLGATRPLATLLALAALAFPPSVFTAWAPGVPEMPCVALLLAAVVVLLPPRGHDPPSPARALGAGLLLTLACGHRYEAWFASAGVAAGALLLFAPRPRTARSLAALAALALGAALVPAFWLVLNHVRDGHALAFVSRVVRYRAAHEPLPPLAARVARYPALLAVHAGVLALVALVGARAVGRRALVPTLGACAVLAWLIVTEVEGGGGTHHVARSLLPSVWLLAPVAAAALSRLAARGARSHAVALVLATLCAVQCAAGLHDVPRDVSPDTVAAGRAVARRTAGDGCYLVELARLDFLWVELASGAPERARPDRRFGAEGPDADALVARAQGCAVAAVSSPEAERALATAGFRAAESHGAWRVLTRDR